MNIRDAILDFFYPKFCLGCGKERTYLCPQCFSKIKTFNAPFCPYCQLRSSESKICKKCRKNLTGFVSAASYSSELIRKIIDAFKYNFVKELAEPLAFLILKFLKENPEIEFFKNPLDFLIIPIPLYPRRLRWRGFNQSTEIGKIISPLIKIPLREDILLRRKNTEPQVGLKEEKEKKENIKNAFLVNIKLVSEIQDKKIILLDDVATSISTIEEAAGIFKENGVKKVWGLTVAKG